MEIISQNVLESNYLESVDLSYKLETFQWRTIRLLKRKLRAKFSIVKGGNNLRQQHTVSFKLGVSAAAAASAHSASGSGEEDN